MTTYNWKLSDIWLLQLRLADLQNGCSPDKNCESVQSNNLQGMVCTQLLLFTVYTKASSMKVKHSHYKL